MWMMTVPVISTAHLSFETLNEEITSDNAGPGDLYCVKFPEGFMVYNDEDANFLREDSTVPADLVLVLAWAQSSGYEWVRFDASGDVVEGLPVYEHA